MKDPRKTILISGIICLVIAILASVNIYLDIVRSLPIYLIVRRYQHNYFFWHWHLHDSSI